MTTALLRAEQALIQIVHVECYIDDMYFQNLCTKKNHFCAKSLAAPEIGAMPQIRDKGKSVLNMSYYLTKNTKVCLTKIQLEYPLSYFLPRNAPNSVINCPDFAFS